MMAWLVSWVRRGANTNDANETNNQFHTAFASQLLKNEAYGHGRLGYINLATGMPAMRPAAVLARRLRVAELYGAEVSS